jgi:hypothetical protein
VRTATSHTRMRRLVGLQLGQMSRRVSDPGNRSRDRPPPKHRDDGLRLSIMASDCRRPAAARGPRRPWRAFTGPVPPQRQRRPAGCARHEQAPAQNRESSTRPPTCPTPRPAVTRVPTRNHARLLTSVPTALNTLVTARSTPHHLRTSITRGRPADRNRLIGAISGTSAPPIGTSRRPAFASAYTPASRIAGDSVSPSLSVAEENRPSNAAVSARATLDAFYEKVSGAESFGVEFWVFDAVG